MISPADAVADAFLDDPFKHALFAARLCALDPGLGGMVLRGGGDLGGIVVKALLAQLPAPAPCRRLPAHGDDEALLGGIDLTATLASGTKVLRKGLLAEADGGVVIVPMAERLSDALSGRLAATLDNGWVETGEIDRNADARFLLVALDQGREADERPPAGLADRLAFWIDLSTSNVGLALDESDEPSGTEPATAKPRRAEDISAEADAETLTTLVATAMALGIDSARASHFALRAARASARLAGRAAIADEDMALAARLVLAPRATRVPMAAEPPETDLEDAPSPPPDFPPDASDDAADGTDSRPDSDEEERGEPGKVDDVVLAAALASLPRDVLARLAAGATTGRRKIEARGAGERRKSGSRGRPMGALVGMPGGGRQLSLIDTLRAAVPWQKLRGGGGDGRIQVRRADLRIRRFETRAEAVTIFAVDASGSAAVARLAEAKGAVELMLAEAYVKRAQVALVAFRGTGAELLLPPTRSLARARRSLAALPGGGGTPLAAGLNAARELAEAARARGRTPFIVILTDGRANIAADGRAVREAAQADAEAAGRAIAAAGIGAAFVDISARPRPEGAALSALIGARYLPLPRADAAAMHRAIRTAQTT